MKFLASLGFTAALCIVSVISYLLHIVLLEIFSVFVNWIYVKNSFLGKIFIDLFYEAALFIVFFVSSFLLKNSTRYSTDRAWFYAVFSTLVVLWQVTLHRSASGLEHLSIYSMPALGVFSALLIRNAANNYFKSTD